MILAIQILATVSIVMGFLLAMRGIDLPDEMPGPVRFLVAAISTGVIVVVWLAPMAGVIVILSGGILRKLRQGNVR